MKEVIPMNDRAVVNLTEFLSLLRESKDIPRSIGIQLGLHDENIDLYSIEQLTEALIGNNNDENYPSDIEVYFRDHRLSDQEMAWIAGMLKTGIKPKKLYLSFDRENCNDASVAVIADALTESKSLGDHTLVLSMSHGDISNQGAVALANALKKNCPYDSVELFLNNNDIEDDGAIALAKLLKGGKCRYLNLRDNRKISDLGAIAFGEAFETGGNNLKGVCVDLRNIPYINSEGIEKIMRGLSSGTCAAGVCIRLNFSVDEIEQCAKMQIIARALNSGQCPPGLCLDFSFGGIKDEAIKILADAMQQGHFPPGLQLNLSHNVIGDDGAKALAAALPACPPGFYIDLSFNNKMRLTEPSIGVGQQAILDVLKSGRCPYGFNICLLTEEVCNPELYAQVNDLLKKNEERWTALSCVAFFSQKSLRAGQLPTDIICSILPFFLGSSLDDAKTAETITSNIMTAANPKGWQPGSRFYQRREEIKARQEDKENEAANTDEKNPLGPPQRKKSS